MNLTGKCKIDFEKYAIKDVPNIMVHKLKNGDIKLHDIFYDLPESMQYGVYVDFFDGFNFIDIDEIYNGEYYLIAINYQNEINHRPQTRIEAIKTANEIYNKVKK